VSHFGFGRGFGPLMRPPCTGATRDLRRKRCKSLNSPIGTIQNSGMSPLKAGLIYFLLVFALGWVLGPIRELWAVPRFGRIAALLVEAVIMLVAMVVSSWWVMRRFNVPQTLGSTIRMGLVALAILAPAEIAGVLWVRGISLREYLASFVTSPGVISLVMFLVFAAMPSLGVANKGQDCEAVGGWHRWYKSTDEIDGCDHCEMTRRRLLH